MLVLLHAAAPHPAKPHGALVVGMDRPPCEPVMPRANRVGKHHRRVWFGFPLACHDTIHDASAISSYSGSKYSIGSTGSLGFIDVAPHQSSDLGIHAMQRGRQDRIKAADRRGHGRSMPSCPQRLGRKMPAGWERWRRAKIGCPYARHEAPGLDDFHRPFLRHQHLRLVCSVCRRNRRKLRAGQ